MQPAATIRYVSGSHAPADFGQDVGEVRRLSGPAAFTDHLVGYNRSVPSKALEHVDPEAETLLLMVVVGCWHGGRNVAQGGNGNQNKCEGKVLPND